MAGFNPLAAVQEGYDFAQGLRNDRTMRQAGNALAGGDYGAAKNALYQGGMVGEGQQVERYQQGQEDRQRGMADQEHAKQLEFIVKAGTIMQNVARQRGPQALAGAFDELAPVFKMMGADDAQLGQYKQAILTNPAVLDAIVGQADQELKIMSGKNGAIYGVNPRTAQAVEIVKGEPNPIAMDPYKNYYMPEDRGPTQAPSGSPRNVRNNNPGNIEDGPFAKTLPGYAGSDGRFAIFNDAQSGTGAQVALLRSYGQRGFNTVSKIINRWAPPSDNNPTPAYVQFVAGKLGVSPDQPLDLNNPQVAQAVAGAIAQFEGGGQSSSNGGVPGMRQIQQAQPKKEPAPSGYRWNASGNLEPIPGGPGDPATQRAKQKPPTAQDKQNVNYTYRVLGANDRLNSVIEGGTPKPSAWKLVSDKNGVTRIALSNPKDRAFVQAAKEWLAPILRKDTGAAVTDTEFAQYSDIYIPAPEDPPEVLKNKANARQDAMIALAGQAGPLYSQTYGQRKFRSAWAPPNKAAKTSGDGWKVVGVR